MLKAIVMILLTLSACLVSEGRAQKTSKRIETPHERFERKGGRKISTEIIVNEDWEVTAAIIAKERDLQLYDQGGHFDCRSWTPPALKNGRGNELKIASALETARNFIWEHWQNKKRGYIRVTFAGVDAVGTSHIFIEPDANGVWQIFLTVATLQALNEKPPSNVIDFPTIRRVERKVIKGKITSLTFKDADGEEWQTL